MVLSEQHKVISRLLKEAEDAMDKNLNKAYVLTDEAYLKSLEMGDHEGISESTMLFGMIKFRMREFSAANEYFESCLNIADKNDDLSLRSRALKNMGDLRLEVNDYESALEFYLSCLEISSRGTHTTEQKMDILMGLGRIYKELEQYNIALEYFEEAENLCQQKKNVSCLSRLYSYIAECTMDDGRLADAEKSVHHAIQLATDSGSEFDFGYAYMVYAKYLYVHSDYKESKVFFEKSIKKFSANHNTYYLLEAMAEYGIMLFKSEAFREAENVLSESSLMLINERNFKVELKINLYLAKLYEKTGKIEKALSYYKRFFEMKTVNDETWKTIKVKNIINKYEYLRTDIKVKELTDINENLVELSKLGRQITSTMNQDEIIEQINKSIHQLIECERFGIGFLNEESGVLDYVTVFEGHQSHVKIDLTKPSFLADILKKGIDFIDNDFITTQNLKSVSVLFNGVDKSASLMSCPLTFEKETIGVLVVQSSQKNAFKDNDLEMLRILASYTSIAINNSMQSKAILETNKKLKDLTEKDGLTKVFNRYSLNTNIGKILQKSKKNEKPLSVVMIDVDFFKEYNDNYGHLAGDHCLISVCNVLNQVCAKEKSYIYRYGGDEFVVIIMDRDENEAEQLANEMCKGVQNLGIEHLFSKCSDRVSITIGVATMKRFESDYKKIFALADKALYNAKSKGRNNVKHLMYE